jgi:hypothetical protein
MGTSTRSSIRRSRAGRRAAGVMMAAVIGSGGLAACGNLEGSEAGAVTTADLQRIEDDLGELENRIGVLEDGVAENPSADHPVEDASGVLENADVFVGQDVTVSAGVTEVMTSTDVGSAFRIGGSTGEAIAVVTATPPDRLQQADEVRVSGTVTTVRRDSFEEDFGIAADELFDDVDGFFSDVEGEVAIAADRIEVVSEHADD